MALADFCPFLHNTVTPLNLPNNKKAFAECYQEGGIDHGLSRGMGRLVLEDRRGERMEVSELRKCFYFYELALFGWVASLVVWLVACLECDATKKQKGHKRVDSRFSTLSSIFFAGSQPEGPASLSSWTG